MGVANNIVSIVWRGSGSFYLILISLIGFLNATQDLSEACSVVELDKAIFQGTYQIASSSSCVIFRFEKTPVNSDPSDWVGRNVFVTIYNVSVSPMFGAPDLDDDDVESQAKKLSRYCGCNVCAAPLDSDPSSLGNSSSSISVENRILQSIACLPTMSAQGRHFRIPVGGRLLIVAKKESSLYAYRLSYKYVYESVCPAPGISNDASVFTQNPRAAQWCLGSVQLSDGNVDDGHPICIASQWFCDGFVDCLDRSDESCCPPQFTLCAAWQGLAGKCVPRCNGYSECQQGATELDCRLVDCPEPNLSCRVPSDDPYSDQTAGGFQCLPANRRCNGLAECAEALDELGCDASNCGPENGTYLCESDITGRCIRQDFVCDGQPHCPNADDETFCPILSRRLNIVLCMSGLFSCASVLFVIAYFHRRYCMAYRRNRGRHRRRRFDLMSPVEQAARYFMQMCGAPPSYSQVMQMGGDGESLVPGVAPMDEPPLVPGATVSTATATVDVIPPPPPLPQVGPSDRDVSISCDDESSEAEYLSTLAFPNNNNNNNTLNLNFNNNNARPSSSNFNNTSVQIQHQEAPVFMLQRPNQDEPAEYAECADDPCPPPAFATTVSSDVDASLCSSHIEMTTTCSSTIASESGSLHHHQTSPSDYATTTTNNNDDDDESSQQVLTHLHRRQSSSEDSQH